MNLQGPDEGIAEEEAESGLYDVKEVQPGCTRPTRSSRSASAAGVSYVAHL